MAGRRVHRHGCRSIVQALEGCDCPEQEHDHDEDASSRGRHEPATRPADRSFGVEPDRQGRGALIEEIANLLFEIVHVSGHPVHLAVAVEAFPDLWIRAIEPSLDGTPSLPQFATQEDPRRTAGPGQFAAAPEETAAQSTACPDVQVLIRDRARPHATSNAAPPSLRPGGGSSSWTGSRRFGAGRRRRRRVRGYGRAFGSPARMRHVRGLLPPLGPRRAGRRGARRRARGERTARPGDHAPRRYSSELPIITLGSTHEGRAGVTSCCVEWRARKKKGVKGHGKLPVRGHEISPLMASISPH